MVADIHRRGLLAGAASAAVAGCADAPPAGAIRLRMATDNSRSHLQTQALQRFADALSAAWPGRFHVELFPSGQLYYDRDLARAVYRGDLDMAAPTNMILSRIVPECGVTALPAFYGRGPETTHRVIDGPIGQALERRIASKLGVVIPGAPIDLGPVGLFLAKKAARRSPELGGVKIRIPSGAMAVLRLRALGAYPVMLPFADVSLALSQGVIDALESTNETARTGHLWDSGIVGALEHRPLFAQYIPLISGRFWRRLNPAMRASAIVIWREVALNTRSASAQRQAAARAICESHGITYRDTDAATARQVRAKLAPATSVMVQRLGMDPAIVDATLRLVATEGA